METFTARCPYSQKIIITKASYGHLRIGRCIAIDLGHFGCSANVENILDKRCAGKQRCEISMPDEEIGATNPCVKGLATYLEASYACIPGNTEPLNMNSEPWSASLDIALFMNALKHQIYYNKHK